MTDDRSLGEATPATSRRRLLACLGTGSLAGCLGGDTDGDSAGDATGEQDGDGADWETGTPRSGTVGTDSAERARICGEGDRVGLAQSAARQSFRGFEIDATRATIRVGSTVGIRVLNDSGSRVTVGDERRFDVQRDTDDGWRSVFRADAPVSLGDAERTVADGESLTWRLRLTSEALTHRLGDGGDLLVCCDSLTAGTYRFVYWGIPSERTEADGVGIRFDLVGSESSSE
ncbi:MAG: hypothetical protein ABEI99_04120 [Halobaculum sp.]